MQITYKMLVKNITQDVIVMLVINIVLLLIFIQIDLLETVYHFSRNHE
jgi:hypothetical protein